MRVVLAFLVWLFSFWTWKAFFLRWVRWWPPSRPASGETAREEHLSSQEGQQESELSRFLSSLPEDVGRYPLLSFDEEASKVTISYGRRQFEVLHGTDLHSGYREFLGSVASSKFVFRRGLQVSLRSEECCKHMEAFGDALRQSDHVLRKLKIACIGGSAIQFAKCVSSVVLGNDTIQDLNIGFHGVKGIMGKVGAAEFMASIASPYNLRILKTFQFYSVSLDGEQMEQLMKPFKCPHSVLKAFNCNSLTADVQLEHISGILATSTSLKSLFLDSKAKKVFARGYTILAIALGSNQSLKTLSCRISSSVELKALLDPLLPININVECNTTFTKLEL